MATVKVTLDKRENSKNSEGKYPIVLRIGHDRKTRDIPFNIHQHESEFDPIEIKLKGIQNRVFHSKRIQKNFSAIDLWIDENKADIKLWPINKLKDQIEKRFFNKQSELTLLGFAAKHLYRLHAEGRYPTASSYEDALKAFVKYKMKLSNKSDKVNISTLFNKNKAEIAAQKLDSFILLEEYQDYDMPIKALDPEFMKDFKAYMSTRFGSMNTVGIYLRSLGAILSDAGKSFEDLKGHNPLENIKKGSTPNKVNYLTLEELDKLRKVELPFMSPAYRARLYFLFMFNNMGMNFFDVVLIKRCDFDGERIRYFRSKTMREGDFFSVAQSPEALMVIDHYLKLNHDPDDYLFPVLIQDMPEERIFRVKNNNVKWFNKHIKKVAETAGIEKNITTYTARDTWSNTALDMGIDIRQVSAGLGHSTVEVTQKSYAAKLQEQVLDSINARVTKMPKPD
ncbi:MAG: tyrosine-type recombinase/integrase [Cyclobacteriaceae bacterium]